MRVPICYKVLFDYDSSEFDTLEKYYDEYFEEFVDPSLEDIKEFLFEKEYHKDYTMPGWYLEPGAKDFIKDVETQWLCNKIGDSLWILDNLYELTDFLKVKYKKEVLRKIENILMADYPENYELISVEVE